MSAQNNNNPALQQTILLSLQQQQNNNNLRQQQQNTNAQLARRLQEEEYARQSSNPSSGQSSSPNRNVNSSENTTLYRNYVQGRSISAFLMPIITEARLRVAGRPIPQELLNQSASIIRNLGVNYSEQHYNNFVNEIVAYLMINDRLQQLINQYKVNNRGNDLASLPGHISANNQDNLTNHMNGRALIELAIGQTYNPAGLIGGKKTKKTKKTKKIRKHKGIYQTGGNKGRLRKGYRYSGKKLKSGLPQIIKCKSKKC